MSVLMSYVYKHGHINKLCDILLIYVANKIQKYLKDFCPLGRLSLKMQNKIDLFLACRFKNFKNHNYFI